MSSGHENRPSQGCFEWLIPGQQSVNLGKNSKQFLYCAWEIQKNYICPSCAYVDCIYFNLIESNFLKCYKNIIEALKTSAKNEYSEIFPGNLSKAFANKTDTYWIYEPSSKFELFGIPIELRCSCIKRLVVKLGQKQGINFDESRRAITSFIFVLKLFILLHSCLLPWKRKQIK